MMGRAIPLKVGLLQKAQEPCKLNGAILRTSQESSINIFGSHHCTADCPWSWGHLCCQFSGSNSMSYIMPYHLWPCQEICCCQLPHFMTSQFILIRLSGQVLKKLIIDWETPFQRTARFFPYFVCVCARTHTNCSRRREVIITKMNKRHLFI